MPITTTTDAIATLRGDLSRRPRIDRDLSGGLRAWLNDECFTLFGDDSLTSISASPWNLTHAEVPSSALSIARAVLVTVLFTQRVLGGTVSHPMDDALSALEADVTAAPLTHEIHQLDPDRFSLLAAEVTAHYEVLSQHLSCIRSAWLPRFQVRSTLSLHGNQVTLNATTDLMLGPPPRDVASVALFDVTTAAHDEHTVDELRIRALIETLRSGVQPFAVASLSSATGSLELLEIQEADLVDAVRLCIAGIGKSLHG